MITRRGLNGSLRAKLTLIYSALFGVIILLVAAAVYFSIKINAERSVERELNASVAAFDRLWQLSGEHMAANADVLAADFGFREAVASEDLDTVASALANAMARYDGLEILVAFPDGRYVDSGGVSGQLDDAVFAALTDSERPSGVLASGGRNYQAVAVPVKAPILVGWAIFRSDLDASRMQELEQMSAIPVKASLQPLAGAPGTEGEIFRTRDAIGASQMIRSFGATQPARLVITYPLDAAMAPYRPMLLAILFFSLFGAVLLAISGGIVARSLTRPIGALDRAVQALAAGKREPVDVSTGDEFGRLAKSFNAMLGELETREAAIVRLAREDVETHLSNRRAMDDDLKAMGTEFTRIAVIRVLRFQNVRAAIGHAAAAQAVEVLAARISDFTGVRPYRISSGDIGLVLPASSRFARLDALRQVVAGCSQPATIGDASVDLLLCGGLAEPERGLDLPIGAIDQAVVAADFAEARQVPVALFDRETYGNPAATLSLMSEMLAAMPAGELALHYQPKFSLSAERVTGLEALIRWEHPVRGRIFPDSFIPIAEETGHIRQLTEWVVVRAIEDQRSLKARGHDLPISVNVSGRQLNDESFALWAIGKVRSTGANLCFEITETAVIADPEKALRLINLFRSAGIGISIDDYGAGLSSLSYLKQIPANELKIDKSFILTLTEGRSDQLMIKSTIDLAHAMGMSVVAEGVETEHALALLKIMGADSAQGYFIARPQPLEAMLDYLNADVRHRESA